MNNANATVAGAGQCPKAESVSAYYDKELSVDALDALHIKSCSECEKVLNAYDSIAKGLKKKLSAQAPENISASIAAGVHRKLALETNKSKSISFPFNFSRIAALFAVCGFAVFFTFKMMNYKQSGAEGAGPAAIAKPISSGLSGTALEGAIPYENFQKVNFSSDKPAKVKGVVIPASVRQVWVANNLESAEKKIGEIAKKIGIPPASFKFKTGKSGSMQVSADLSKSQLVAFVRSCRIFGFKLMSPQAPQPEQNVFEGNGNDKVSYKADFVLNGK